MHSNWIQHWHLMHSNWIQHWHLIHSHWIQHWYLMYGNWIHHWHLTHVNWIHHWHLMAEAWMRTAHKVKRRTSQTHSTVGMLSAHTKHCNSWLIAERPLKWKQSFIMLLLLKTNCLQCFQALPPPDACTESFTCKLTGKQNHAQVCWRPVKTNFSAVGFFRGKKNK